MLTLLTTFFAWAVKSPFIAGLFSIVGSKIYLLLEDLFKKKYFPKKDEVIIEHICDKPVKRKIVQKKDKYTFVWIMIGISLLLIAYVLAVVWELQYITSIAEKRNAIEQVRLILILCLSFLLAKATTFNSAFLDFLKWVFSIFSRKK